MDKQFSCFHKPGDMNTLHANEHSNLIPSPYSIGLMTNMIGSLHPLAQGLACPIVCLTSVSRFRASDAPMETSQYA